jgi:nascent polypeptide-associated complex subunit beta
MCLFALMILVVVDDSKLSGVLKKMALQPLNGVEEVNIFKDNGEVIHIVQPKSKSVML